MKPKKNPKADLNKNSGLYFVIGLALVLFLTWRALELKSYDTSISEAIIAHTMEPDLDEEVPITKEVTPPPPTLPPSAPTIIEVVEDTEEIEETIIQSTETDQEASIDAPVLLVDDVSMEEVEEEITVPFAVIEDVPIFPGCENGTNADKRVCFQKKVQEHIKENFKYPPIALEMGIQGKVYVQFIINSNGHVTSIKTRGPDKLLEQEAKRIMASLPQMIPGKQRGIAVNVPYSIPVNFKLMM
ncbi:energy transducer TonB [uncultured Croceitalea sp.]|uniref:energy transducer TonB n=1 Tax=uncultured Croceitalea sp. TaxID=1798908 RepID=UPI00374FB02A